MGETGERLGLTGRWSRHKTRLNSGKGINQLLQKDWDLFGGGDAFEFIVIDHGIQWVDTKTRQSRETELIRDYREKGYTLYNFYDSAEQRRVPSCLLSSREICLRNQTQEFRDYISQLNTGRPNLNRTSLVADGLVFLSIAEAANYYKVSRRVIREKLKSKGSNYCQATPEQVNQEIQRRQQLGIVKLEPPEDFSFKKRTSGFFKRVQINGQVYESLSAAARALNVSPQAISMSIKRGRAGYIFLDE